MKNPTTSLHDWKIQINGRVEGMSDTIREVTEFLRCIYRVPHHVADRDETGAYKPRVVSFGPYHYGEEHLKPMEEQKVRALVHILKRTKRKVQDYFNALSRLNYHEQFIKDYDQLDHRKWQGDADDDDDVAAAAADDDDDNQEFLKLMILDGCFILEILRIKPRDNSTTIDFDNSDLTEPLWNTHGFLNTMSLIKRDMLLLENQVPFRVLETLLQLETGVEAEDINYENLIGLILNFFFDIKLGRNHEQLPREDTRHVHILQVYRQFLLYHFQLPSTVQPDRYKFGHQHQLIDNNIIPSATSLFEAGIKFGESKLPSLMDISFNGNTLSVPSFVVKDETKSLLLNLMAFERLHVWSGRQVTSYVLFMGCLIRTAQDLDLLRSRSIVRNQLGIDDDEIVKMFSLICKDVAQDPGTILDQVYEEVSQLLKRRFRKKLHEWRIDLLRTYFKTPWGVLSVVAAIVLFTLSTIQTVYAVLAYIHPK